MALELEGKPAPAFTLKGSDGKNHTLKEYAGKTVVLYFYPKDNTPGCTRQACGFRDLSADLGALNAVVLGVSRDGLDSHEKFIGDFNLPFVLLTDPDAETMRRYGAFGEKQSYGKTVQGVIRSTFVIGPDGTVLKAWSPVRNAEENPKEVAAFLQGL